MQKLIFALAIIVCGSVQAAPTYSFSLETMVYRDGYAPPGVTPTVSDFLVAQTMLGEMRATLDDPSSLGTMEFHYDDQGGGGSVTFSATELAFHAIGGIDTTVPGCVWSVCDLSAALSRDGPGLAGALLLASGEMQLNIAGDRDGWSGTWNTDNPYGQYNITGRWHVVPLPGTLALFGLGLLAVGLIARRAVVDQP